MIILAVVLLIFGGAKLPQLARSMGLAKKEFEGAAAESDKKKSPPEPDDTSSST